MTDDERLQSLMDKHETLESLITASDTDRREYEIRTAIEGIGRKERKALDGHPEYFDDLLIGALRLAFGKDEDESTGDLDEILGMN